MNALYVVRALFQPVTIINVNRILNLITVAEIEKQNSKID